MLRQVLAIALLPGLGVGSEMAFAQTAAPAASRAMANNEATYVKLRNIHFGQETIPVSNFTLKRDAGTFVFKSGTFYLLEPVNNKITGAVFVGDATFALKPPIPVEQQQSAQSAVTSALQSAHMMLPQMGGSLPPTMPTGTI